MGGPGSGPRPGQGKGKKKKSKFKPVQTKKEIAAIRKRAIASPGSYARPITHKMQKAFWKKYGKG